MSQLIPFVASSIVLFGLDTLWLLSYMGNQYAAMIPRIQQSPMNVNIVFACFAYVLMILGLYVFIIPSLHSKSTWKDCLYYGGLFGLVMYGVYDCTAGAVLTEWDTSVAIVDIMWGMIVYTLAAKTYVWWLQ